MNQDLLSGEAGRLFAPVILLGVVFVLLLLAGFCHCPQAYICRARSFQLKCLCQFVKAAALFCKGVVYCLEGYRRCLECVLSLLHCVDLCFDYLCYVFRVHKCNTDMPNDPI